MKDRCGLKSSQHGYLQHRPGILSLLGLMHSFQANAQSEIIGVGAAQYSLQLDREIEAYSPVTAVRP